MVGNRRNEYVHVFTINLNLHVRDVLHILGSNYSTRHLYYTVSGSVHTFASLHLHILVEGTQVSQFAVVYNLRAFERGSIFGTNEVHVCGITKPLTS